MIGIAVALLVGGVTVSQQTKMGRQIDARLDWNSRTIVIREQATTNRLQVLDENVAECLSGSLLLWGSQDLVSNGLASIGEMCGRTMEIGGMLIDGKASVRSDCPTWQEILSCSAVDTNGIQNLFHAASVSNDIRSQIESSVDCRDYGSFNSVEDAKTFRLLTKGGDVLYLRFNTMASKCMCHKRFAMRVYNATGKWVWQELDEVYGKCDVYVGDVNDDGKDDIVIRRESHDPARVLLWTQTNQEGRKRGQEEPTRLRSSR